MGGRPTQLQSADILGGGVEACGEGVYNKFMYCKYKVL